MVDDIPKKMIVDYPAAINGFAGAMRNFPVKKILYRPIFRGRGVEFDSYRSFEPDDDASFIDWKASLRTNTLLAKKYIEERDLYVYFFIDVSNSMLFGSRDKLKAEYTAEVVAALAHLILEAGDKIGLVLFNNEIVKFVPPANGKKHFFMISQILSDSKFYGGDFSMDTPLDYVLKMVKTDYTIFIIVSDFIKMHKTVEMKLKMLSAKFETLAIMVRDPLDESLPLTNVQLSVSDPYSNRQIIIDPKIAYVQYKKSVMEQKKRLKELFIRTGVDLLELNTEKDFYLSLALFLKKRSVGERI